MSNPTPPVIAPNPPAGAPMPPHPLPHASFTLTTGTPPMGLPPIAEPDVRSIFAHPRRKRASAAFWILLIAILVIGFGFMATGGFGAFGGY